MTIKSSAWCVYLCLCIDAKLLGTSRALQTRYTPLIKQKSEKKASDAHKSPATLNVISLSGLKGFAYFYLFLYVGASARFQSANS